MPTGRPPTKQLLPTVLLLTLGACAADDGDGRDDFDDEKAATSVAALDVGTSAATLDDLDTADPVQAASRIAAGKADGCRARSIDPASPNVLHVVLDRCGGRFDRHSVSGRLTVTFSSKPDGTLHADTTSEELTIDGRPFSRTVSEDIRIEGSTRTVKRHSEKVGTKRSGESLSQVKDDIVVFDRATRCRTENGTGHAVVAGSRNITTTVTELRTCDGPDGQEYCPTGTIEHVNQTKGKTVLTTFDGTTAARIDVSKPKKETSSTWTLACLAR